VSIPATAVILVLLIGASLMAIGIKTGYPIATAFTVTGSVVGVGFALGGTPIWAKYLQIAAVWTLTPFVGGGLAYGIASVLPRADVPEEYSVPVLAGLVGAVMANVEFAYLGVGKTPGSLARFVGRSVHPEGLAVPVIFSVLFAGSIAGSVSMDIRRNEQGGLRRVLLALGSLVAFSAGGSQVGLAVGPLLPLLEEARAIPLIAVLIGGGFGILVGSWTGAPRMIKSLARDYSSLGPRRSIAALVPAFLIAQLAVLLGVPVSFNEIIVSAIIGSGAAVGGRSAIDRRKIGMTVGAWVGSLAFVLGLGYVAVALLPFI
jgi:PiT family inorganic phosphate transporter